ncbi:RNA-binding region-containing protein [Spraguea lophii 42_110]|uniref:RNA-binding region-containing protein n=1 Tax=Spraguea lophii (strain 42_110) TaxID=1358809 RepID=S7XK35_SPRLO|nr:RNA-binding region-containing protein [Spraguea lophii 42_110]
MISQILYIENITFTTSEKTLYEIFSSYGTILEIRIGNNTTTQGTAYIVYSDKKYAIKAQKYTSGMLVENNYISVTFYDVIRKLIEYEKSKTKRLLAEAKLNLK